MLNKMKKLFKIWRIKNDIKGLKKVLNEIDKIIYSNQRRLCEMRAKIMHGKRDAEFYKEEMERLVEDTKIYENVLKDTKIKINSLELELNEVLNK